MRNWLLVLMSAAVAAACASGGGGGDDPQTGCRTAADCRRGQVCESGACRTPRADAGPDSGESDAEVTPDAGPDVGPTPDAAPVVDAAPDGAPPADGGDLDARPVDGAPVDDAQPEDAAPAVDARPDAAPDAGPCLAGSVEDCGRNQGRCRAGTRQCQPDGTWGACVGEIGPTSEVCNNADDDCNGVADDGFDIGAACEGIGDCGGGTVECRNDVLTRCSSDLGGSRAGDTPETCNGTDEDCDGLIDEDFALGEDCVGACGPGATECSAGGEVMCSTDPGGTEHGQRDEMCNGRDDDCNGAVDDGFGLGEPCDGVGACGEGVRECAPGGDVRCSTDPGGSAAQVQLERCNGVDDDCDGRTDEDFAVGEVCEGAGACGAGRTECSPDGALRCSTDPGGSQSQAGVELCNRQDDDCDGQVDEDLGLGGACPAVGVCPAGTVECAGDGTTRCSTAPGGSADASEAETCDGRDQDCDGTVDDGFAVGEPCEGVGACGAGVRECDGNGGARCSTGPGGSQSQARPEACNGADDDCDGVVDDGGACGGDTCGTAPLLGAEGMITGDTRDLANDYARSTCTGASEGPDQVFRFEAAAAGDWVIGAAPLAQFSVLFWPAADCAQLATCLVQGRGAQAAGRPAVNTVRVPRAGTFFVVVDGPTVADAGPFAFTARPKADGETCGTAVALTPPARFVGTTVGRVSDIAGRVCPVAASDTLGPDQVFRVNVARAGRLRVSLTPGDAYTPALALATNCGQVHETCVGSALAPRAGASVQIEAQVEPGAYYVVVDQTGQGGGPFLLEVTQAP